MTTERDCPCEQAVLANGRSVTIRASAPDDFDRVRAFYDRLGDTATYYRFFGIRPHLPDAEVWRTVRADQVDHLTLLASIGGELIGIGEYVVKPGGDEAEVAFCVADDHHREGVATLLLERLAIAAHRRGLKHLVASTLFGNSDMLLVFRTVGLSEQTHLNHGVVEVSLDLSDMDGLHARAAERHEQALSSRGFG